MSTIRMLFATTLAGCAALAGLGVCSADATAYRPVWLCRPGLAHNPCVSSLQTGIFSAAGTLQNTVTPSANPNAPVDCFYVYPTVSAETTPLSDLKVQAAERDVALYQAAYYQGVCRVYAPMYHQVTLSGAANPLAITPAYAAEQYTSVLDAWRYYLEHYNHGRPFVLIGHSQGAFVLRKLIAQQIDPNPTLRRRLLSAILFGGAVVVKAGSLVGGSFKNIPGCSSTTQLGCVVSYSSFPGPPPTGAVFGDTTWSPTDARGTVPPGDAILCTNPASLAGGAGTLESVFPVSFPSGNGVLIPAAEIPGRAGATAWLDYNGSYSAQCTQSGASNFLEVTPLNNAPALTSTGALAPLWGLHPLDANLALGNIVSLIASETTAYRPTAARRLPGH